MQRREFVNSELDQALEDKMRFNIVAWVANIIACAVFLLYLLFGGQQ
jgi:hypothetical protein